jgi:[ribosomal protein S5]-alanine N-acetyltransferase
MNDELTTGRLRLLPITLEIADAILTDRDRLEALIDGRVAAEWPNADFQDALAYIRADVRKNTSFSKWSRVIVHKKDNVLIGDAGFKSVPSENGSVEIGYGIAPSYRNRGFAAEAAQALIQWAFENHRVRRITAECLDNNFPSKRVLEKLGMESTGTHTSRDGMLMKWRLERNRPLAAH